MVIQTGNGGETSTNMSRMTISTPTVSSKSKTTTLILAIFLGILGIHRFYVGKIGTGILMFILCWMGISEIMWIIDIINICCGKFTDSEGKPIVK